MLCGQREHLLRVGQPALDPGAQLVYSGCRRALRGARGKHDLDPGVRVDVHAHPPRAGGAAHGVGDLGQVRGVGHRHPEGTCPTGRLTPYEAADGSPRVVEELGTGIVETADIAFSHGFASFSADRIARVAGERLSV